MNNALTMWELGDVLKLVALSQDWAEEDESFDDFEIWEIPVWKNDPVVEFAWSLILFLLCATIALYWIKG